jgi:hypothetical protein
MTRNRLLLALASLWCVALGGASNALLDATLPNGARALAVEMPSVDSFSYTVVVRCPPTADAEVPTLRKVLAATAFLGLNGVACPEALARMREFAALGGRITAVAQPDHLLFEVSGRAEAAEIGLALLSDAVLRPPLDGESLSVGANSVPPT